jgi:4-hydroxybenzoate polyprenyltransferase
MKSIRAYAELVRLPNVFTAIADVGIGILGTWGLADQHMPATWGFAVCALIVCSATLYSAGMVWNDVFDYSIDQRERPYRPLPSGRISRQHTIVFGFSLFLTALGLSCLAGFGREKWSPLPLSIGFALVVAILAYDGWLKHTPAGPVAMGMCRFLNVLLGLSIWPGRLGAWSLCLAGPVGVYAAGITWFARTEASVSRRGELIGGALAMLGALLLALMVPEVLPTARGSVFFRYLLALTGFWAGLAMWQAIETPTAERVQLAVKRAIFGIIGLDAALATGLAGPIGLVLLLCLIPAALLGRWIYST